MFVLLLTVIALYPGLVAAAAIMSDSDDRKKTNRYHKDGR